MGFWEGVRGLERGLGAPQPRIAEGPAVWGPDPAWALRNCTTFGQLRM